MMIRRDDATPDSEDMDAISLAPLSLAESRSTSHSSSVHGGATVSTSIRKMVVRNVHVAPSSRTTAIEVTQQHEAEDSLTPKEAVMRKLGKRRQSVGSLSSAGSGGRGTPLSRTTTQSTGSSKDPKSPRYYSGGRSKMSEPSLNICG